MGKRIIELDAFIDEIFIDYENNKDSKYVFFLGAGCSITSGIKLANDLAKEWYEKLEKQKSKYDSFNEENNINPSNQINFGELYFNIFETLFPSPLSQQKEIQRLTEDKMPSIGYYGLSEFMQNNSFNTVITTNFDNLIQDALIYNGKKRALVIIHQDLAKFIDRNHTPLIIKIHGDAHLQPFNNSQTTKIIPDKLKSSIQGLLNNAKLIFIGYKGNDESIADLLENCNRIDQVYWCASNEPSDTKLENWWEKLQNKTHVKERDFDKIMSLIKSKFDLSEPDFEKRFRKLKDAYLKNREDETERFEEIKDDTKYTDYFILGNEYFHQKKFEKAIENYEKASRLNPENSDIFYNWGTTLSNLAYIKNDETFYIESIEKYKIASKLNQKNNSIFYNWGNALFDLAKMKNNDEKLHYDAFEKYKIASNLNPNDSDIFNNWGNCLSNLAKIRNNDEKLYNEAFEKYKIASNLNPSNNLIFNNWGASLQNLAKSKNDESLYNEAFKKLTKAFELGANSYNLACHYSLRNNKEKALELLEKVLKNDEISIPHIENDEDWDNLKEDNDFKELIKKYKKES